MTVYNFISVVPLKVNVESGIESFFDDLKQSGVAAVFDNDEFFGLLTPEDFMERPHRIAGDCVKVRIGIKESDTISNALNRMIKERAAILPVFGKNNFLGVIRQEDILSYLLKTTTAFETVLSGCSSTVSDNISSDYSVNLLINSPFIQAFRFKTDGTLTFVNNGYCTAHNTTSQDAVGKKWQDFCVSAEKMQHEKEYETLINNPKVYTCEHTCCRKDFTSCTLLTISPITTSNGKVEEFSAIGVDITEKKNREERDRNIQRLESVGILAGGIAHDFNNLLMGLYGYINMAKTNSSSPEKVNLYIDKSLSVFDLAKDLTTRLLTFSKGGLPNRKSIRLIDIIKETTDLSLHGCNVTYKLILPSNLWKVHADGNQLRQVISNIVINSRQAMPSGGNITIEAVNVPDGSKSDRHLNKKKYVEIIFSDEGQGIPEKILSRIFDPYFSTKSQGSGLGLSVVYSIIQQHEGHVSVESTIGKGTTFHIYLPSTEELCKTDEIPDLNDTEWKGSGKILVMDDEITIREIVRDFIITSGYDVTVAENGTMAIKHIQQALTDNKPFDLMFLDLTVPGDFGGDEILRRIGNMLGTTKAVAMSGYSNNAAITNPSEFGFWKSLDKPFKVQELWNVLREEFHSR